MALNGIVDLRGASKNGGYALAGARRAFERNAGPIKTGRAGGGGLPGAKYRTGHEPELVVEVLGIEEVVAAIRGDLVNQTITLHYRGTEGNLKAYYAWCTCTGVDQVRFPPAEGTEDVPSHSLTFAIHAGDGVATLAEAIIETSDSGDPPAYTLAPVYQLASAYRGQGGTPIPGAVDANLTCTIAKTQAGITPDGLRAGVWPQTTDVVVAVSLEDVAHYRQSLLDGASDEILLLNFWAGAAWRTLTCKWARQVEHGQLEIQAAERSKSLSRPQLIWHVTTGGVVANIRDAVVLT